MCCLEKKKGDGRREREREDEGEGCSALYLKTVGKGGGEREEQTGRRRGSGVEVRGRWLADWRHGWVVSVVRGAGAGLITTHVKVII